MMRKQWAAVLLMLSTALFLQAGMAQEVAIPEATPGERASRLADGEQAPNFRLHDQNDNQRTLEDLLTEGNVALVFHRSADW